MLYVIKKLEIKKKLSASVTDSKFEDIATIMKSKVSNTLSFVKQ